MNCPIYVVTVVWEKWYPGDRAAYVRVYLWLEEHDADTHVANIALLDPFATPSYCVVTP